MIELLISRSPAASRPVIHLRHGQSISLGREAGADYVFNEDAQMSTLHLLVTASDDSLEFADQGSTNGTFLNGTRVSVGQAFDGDELRIGQTVLLVNVHRESKSQPQYKPSPPPVAAPRKSPPAVQQKVVLEIEAEGGVTKRLEPGSSLSVGRTSRAAWVFEDDQRMSSVHFVLGESDGTWELIDSQSSNGTLLNGRRVDRAIIDDDDEVVAGGTRFKMRLIQTRADKLARQDTPESFDTTEEELPALRAAPKLIRKVSEPPQAFAPPSEAVPSQASARNEDRRTEPVTPVPPPRRDMLWLIPRLANVAPVCVTRGSSIAIDPDGLHDDLPSSPSNPSPQVALKWRSQWCEFADLSSSNRVRLNDAPTPRGMLLDGDQLHIGSALFIVRYECTPLPPPDTSHRSPAPSPAESDPGRCNADRLPTRHLAAISDRPESPAPESILRDNTPSEPTETEETESLGDQQAASTSASAPSADDDSEADDLYGTNFDTTDSSNAESISSLPNSLPQQSESSDSAPDLLHEDESSDAAEAGHANVRAEQVANDSLESPSAEEPQADERFADAHATEMNEPEEPFVATQSASGERSDDALIAAEIVTDQFTGRLPDNDLIGTLFKLAAQTASWLLEVDPRAGRCVSLPFKIAVDDAAWILTVQASWPRNNYLIVFSDRDADVIFEAISNLQATQSDPNFFRKPLTAWFDDPAVAAALFAVVSGLMLVDGPQNQWQFVVPRGNLPNLVRELQS